MPTINTIVCQAGAIVSDTTGSGDGALIESSSGVVTAILFEIIAKRRDGSAVQGFSADSVFVCWSQFSSFALTVEEMRLAKERFLQGFRGPMLFVL
jgi:hypothetical protein